MLIFKPLGLVLTGFWLLSILLIAEAGIPAKAQNISILTIVLRDSLGNPLEGVTTEVLSYDWGLEVGKPYSVIAKGETDKNGVVAFDSTPWPFSGYRVKFTPTSHTKPANSYFLPDSDNQYRGYPGISTGGVTETQKFVLSGSDGLIYNDLSKEGQLPEYQRDPVGGMENPRVSVMPGNDFLASVAAATSTAEARGEPTPTYPPPAAASPRPGQIQAALPTTPEVDQTTQAPNTTSVGKTVVTSQLPTVITSPGPVQATGSNRPADASQPNSGSNLFVSALLAIGGIAALVTFWIFRFRIYPLIGIETVPKKRNKHFLVKPKQPAKPRTGPGERKQ